MFGNRTFTIVKEESIVDNISDIGVDWITGEIRIFPSDNNQIKIVQLSDQYVSKDKLFHHQSNDGKLFISDGRKIKARIGFNFQKTILEIHLPKKQLDSMVINSTGGHLHISNIDVIKCKCKVTSGNVDISGRVVELDLNTIACHMNGNDLEIEKLDIKSTSSKINLTGTFSELNMNCIGGKIMVNSATMIKRIHSTSTAAHVKVFLPDNNGFTVKVKKTSSTFKSDFAFTSNQEQYFYKSGEGHFNINSRSGCFELLKA